MADDFDININIVVIIGISGEPVQVELTAIEAAIVNSLRFSSGRTELQYLYSELYRYSRGEILSAVNQLVAKDILINLGSGYYEMNSELRCEFVTNEKERSSVAVITDSEDEAAKKKSAAVKEMWQEAHDEGMKRVQTLQKMLDDTIAEKKERLILKVKEQLSDELEKTTVRLSKLGFFAFKEKRECKDNLKKLQYDMEHTEKSERVVAEVEKWQAIAAQTIADFTKNIEDCLNARFVKTTTTEIISPFDKYGCASGRPAEDDICRQILEYLDIMPRTQDELFELFGGTTAFSLGNKKVYDQIRKLIQYDIIETVWAADDTVYKLKQYFEVNTKECWSLNEKIKEVKWPKMPDVKKLF